MQFVQDPPHSLFRVWELGVSFLGRLCCQYSRAAKGLIALARFIPTWRLFARLSLILGPGIGNGTKERNTVTCT
jgi:hypothetical protein